MNNYDNIPDELKALKSWCVWKYEDIGALKPTKVPYNAKTNIHADVTNPATWSMFHEVVEAQRTHGYSGIGFIFSESDNFSGLDLDIAPDQVTLDRQIKIYREFDSYSEISPSGKGLHIIVKGVVPQGRRRSSIEVYSSGRYFTMTGNVYNRAPIQERQSMLMQLWEQMGAGAPATILYKGDESEKASDGQILEQANNATNSDKFKALFSGQWQDLYQSQSEADFAFIDIIAFYTQNRNQITRIFRNSLLGKRDKASRKDYTQWMINKSFDRMLPPLDLDGFKIALESQINGHKVDTAIVRQEVVSISNGNPGSSPGVAPIASVAQLVEPTAHNRSDIGSTPIASTIQLPPGLLGEIAQFIYQAAPRPVPEIALAGAIGLMAGICGRAYNISGTGLNQYVLLLAKTGRGKESIAYGVDKLMNAIKMQVPTSSKFRGPGIINSGQALIKHLSKTSNCFVSILGEFGITIGKISDKYANSADKMLYQMLLDLYNKSGYGQTLQASIYSKQEDNIGATESPALTIIGESTHKLFYNVLNEDMISAGLLPRFLIIEYNGNRVDSNENHHLTCPSMALVEQFAALIAYCETIMYKKSVINIACNDEAAILLREYDRKTTKQINSSQDDTIAELWNRAHMKVLRLAGLLAVGINMHNPIVSEFDVNWAINIVEHDIKMLSVKFESGEIGANTEEIKQINEMTRIIKEYLIRDWAYASKYSSNQKMHHDKIIPYIYINKRLANNAAFKNDKAGATNSMKRAIQIMIDSDRLREVNKKQLELYGTTQRCFIVSNMNILD